MKRLKLVCVNLALALGMFSLTFQAHAEELTITGSGNPEVLLHALGDAFGRQQSAHKVSVPTSIGTAGALRDVQAGTVVLGRVGRPLRADEAARGLTYIPLGRDPVAFIGGAGVTVKGLTQAQVIDAYTGKVSNWKELGGKPLPIRAVGREASDTLRISIARVVKPFENITFGEGVKTVSFDPQIVELMDRFPGSLGFLNRSGLDRAKTKLVVLDLDGVTPNAQNVAAGRYGIWVDFGLIHKTGALSPGAKAFVDFTRSSEGLRILKEHGVLAPVEQR